MEIKYNIIRKLGIPFITVAITSCQASKQQADQPDLPVEEIIDVVGEQYNNAHNPYEINGRSEAFFREGLSYVKTFRVQHVYYCGPANKDHMRFLIKLVGQMRDQDSPLISLQLIRIDADGDVRYVNGFHLSKLGLNNPDDLNSFLLALSAHTRNNLQVLDLFCNQLTSINLANLNLNQLTNLRLSHNKLTDIDIDSLHQLGDLNLSRNNLITVNVGNQTQLSRCNLSHNQLTTVNGLGNLNALKYLNLSHNNLTSFDVAILDRLGSRLPYSNLSLNLSYNPIKNKDEIKAFCISRNINLKI
ncbi:leucine-rich repeat domain-containing protein [Candidatus Cardinium hertigii]|uniref:Leucine-rich repeat domain-containing protein n=1 Tax=Candidatus Cardinium hertigii TaxID=247481 RepID=A0A3N2QDD9_9BACT|nr:hypothetical protein [Candidatus Cardinium hertigii]ROT47808.1 hypothetical protein EDM02_00325 [Candidatus Cardinium hertigii]